MELAARILPYIGNRPDFALKGGTAVSLFFRDLPRFSVDIDLVYLPITPFDEALDSIYQQLRLIARDIQSATRDPRRIIPRGPNSRDRLKVHFRCNRHRAKVDVTPVGRGTVWPPEIRPAKSLAFGLLEAQVASFEDVYAGKICAALSRQHPRDLFDIKGLLDNERISRKLFITFLAYLVMDRCPISKLLQPKREDISVTYDSEFKGMAKRETSVVELVDAREQLIETLHAAMTDRDRAFLSSVQETNPDCSLIDLPWIERLPGFKWRLTKLTELGDSERDEEERRLAAVLEGI